MTASLKTSLLLAVSLVGVPPCAFGETFTVREQGGGEFCRTVELPLFSPPDLSQELISVPGLYELVRPGPRWYSVFRYEFRRSEGADLGEILITAVRKKEK
jgi:hypothetical protein